MASDYGDDAGEKMIDDFMRFGERMGERAMYRRAERLKLAFENATDKARGAAAADGGRAEPAEWAKLDMAESQKIEGYEGIKDIIEAKLRARSVDSAWFAEPGTGKEHLLFRIADAKEVWRSFDELPRSRRGSRPRAGCGARGRGRSRTGSRSARARSTAAPAGEARARAGAS